MNRLSININTNMRKQSKISQKILTTIPKYNNNLLYKFKIKKKKAPKKSTQKLKMIHNNNNLHLFSKLTHKIKFKKQINFHNNNKLHLFSKLNHKIKFKK